jgi:hypothetical protein
VVVPALIYCAAGGFDFRRAATEAGWLNGARLPGTVYDPPLYFADQDWKNPDRAAYLRAVERHRPAVATVLDWERAEQQDEVFAWAEEVGELVQTVVVIPKVPGTIPDIPAQFGGARVVLGYSVPTSYGGTAVPVREFGDRPVHLLGGSPHRQLALADRLNVVSADGNMLKQQAQRCRFWSRSRGIKGHFVQLRDRSSYAGCGAHVEAFRRSLAEVRAAWEERGVVQQGSAPPPRKLEGHE